MFLRKLLCREDSRAVTPLADHHPGAERAAKRAWDGGEPARLRGDSSAVECTHAHHDTQTEPPPRRAPPGGINEHDLGHSRDSPRYYPSRARAQSLQHTRPVPSPCLAADPRALDSSNRRRRRSPLSRSRGHSRKQQQQEHGELHLKHPSDGSGNAYGTVDAFPPVSEGIGKDSATVSDTDGDTSRTESSENVQSAPSFYDVSPPLPVSVFRRRARSPPFLNHSTPPIPIFNRGSDVSEERRSLEERANEVYLQQREWKMYRRLSGAGMNISSPQVPVPASSDTAIYARHSLSSCDSQLLDDDDQGQGMFAFED